MFKSFSLTLFTSLSLSYTHRDKMQHSALCVVEIISGVKNCFFRISFTFFSFYFPKKFEKKWTVLIFATSVPGYKQELPVSHV